MGNWITKQCENFSVGKHSNNANPTPVKFRLLECDPRSPSNNIERTPIMVWDTPSQDSVQADLHPGDTSTAAILPSSPKKPNGLRNRQKAVRPSAEQAFVDATPKSSK
uniref:Uncharacterized protein n=1 Tax=Trichuris muris TaxID=70415 RepID=A0A5S6QMW8_TRIMR